MSFQLLHDPSPPEEELAELEHPAASKDQSTRVPAHDPGGLQADDALTLVHKLQRENESLSESVEELRIVKRALKAELEAARGEVEQLNSQIAQVNAGREETERNWEAFRKSTRDELLAAKVEIERLKAIAGELETAPGRERSRSFQSSDARSVTNHPRVAIAERNSSPLLNSKTIQPTRGDPTASSTSQKVRVPDNPHHPPTSSVGLEDPQTPPSEANAAPAAEISSRKPQPAFSTQISLSPASIQVDSIQRNVPLTASSRASGKQRAGPDEEQLASNAQGTPDEISHLASGPLATTHQAPTSGVGGSLSPSRAVSVAPAAGLSIPSPTSKEPLPTCPILKREASDALLAPPPLPKRRKPQPPTQSSSIPSTTKRIPKVKLEPLTIPPSVVQRYLADTPAFTIDPPASDLHVSRRFLSSQYGGQAYAFIQYGHADKNPSSHRIRNMVYPKVELNPAMPLQPGASGLMFASRHDTLRNPPWSLFRRHLGGKEAVWLYLGEYECELVGKLTKEDFKSQSDAGKREWGKHVLENRQYPCYVEMRARIALRKCGRADELDLKHGEPEQFGALKEEAEKIKRGRGTDVTLEDIIDAFERGDETVDIIRMKCVSYDRTFANHIEEHYPAFLEELASEDNSTGAAKKRKGKRKRFVADNKSDGDNDDDDDDEDYISARPSTGSSTKKPRPRRNAAASSSRLTLTTVASGSRTVPGAQNEASTSTSQLGQPTPAGNDASLSDSTVASGHPSSSAADTPQLAQAQTMVMEVDIKPLVTADDQGGGDTKDDDSGYLSYVSKQESELEYESDSDWF